MGVRFACHGCGKGLNIKTDLAGKRGKCPHCGLRFRIPHEDQALSIPLDDQLQAAPDAPAQHSSQQHLSEQPLSEPAANEPAANEPAANEPAADESAEFNPLEEADVVWYVRPPTGGRYGPATGPTVIGWIDEGRVTSDTLLWRDGWPQWRECKEVIPGLLAASPAAPAPTAVKTAPATHPFGQPGQLESGVGGEAGGQYAPSQPGVAAGGQVGTMKTSGASRRKKARQFAATGGYDADSHMLAKKRQKAKQRMLAISVLIILSLVLVLALIAALLWEREPPPEETIGRRSLGVTSPLA